MDAHRTGEVLKQADQHTAIGHDLQGVGDVEVVVEERLRPEGHVNLGGHLWNRAQHQREADRRRAAAVPGPEDRTGAQEQGQWHDVEGPRDERSRVQRLRQGWAARGEVHRGIGHQGEAGGDQAQGTALGMHGSRGCRVVAGEPAKPQTERRAEQQGAGVEYPRQRPGKGHEATVRGGRSDDAHGGQGMEGIDGARRE